MVDIKQISDRYSVSGQIQPGDVQAIADAGFTTIVCNRPDGEKPDQPGSDAVRAAAEAAGLAYIYNPAVPGQLTADNVRRQAEAVAASTGPVFAHCASGMRSTTLWALANPEGIDADARIARAREAGYDLEPLRARL
jgi:uncharacterized protein (TIGR01244 family)